MEKQIIQFIKKTRWWLFGQILAGQLLWNMMAAAGLAAVLAGYAYFCPWYRAPVCVTGVFLLAAAAGFLLAVWRFPSASQAAAALDQTGLSERAVTALELINDESSFAKLQKADAWKHMRKVQLRTGLPYRFRWRRILITGILSLLCLIFLLAPSEAKNRAAQNHELALFKQEEQQKLDDAEKTLDEKMQQEEAELSEEEKEEIRDLLKQISTEIQEADSKEAVEKAKERGALKLQEEGEKYKNTSTAEQLKQLAQALGQETSGKNSSQTAGNKTAEDMEAAAENLEKQLQELQESGSTELSEEQQENLLNDIETLEENSSLLSVQDLKNLQDLQNSVSGGKLSSDQLASVQASVSSIKSQARSQQNSSGQNSSEQSSQNAGTSGNGSNSGSQSASTGGGSGQGSGGSGQGSSGSGQGSGGTGEGWNTGSKNGKQEAETYDGEMVSIPNETGDDANLTGKQTDGTSYSSKSDQAITWSGTKTRLDQVIGSYSEKANAQIESSGYPAGMQDMIRDYFTELQGD